MTTAWTSRRRSKMFIVPRWDHLCSDSAWVFHSLACFAEDISVVQGTALRLDFARRRPNMCEISVLSADKTELRSLEDMTTKIISLSKVAPTAFPTEVAEVYEESFDIRPSDFNLIRDVPHAFAFRVMDDSIHGDRPPASYVEITLFEHKLSEVLCEGNKVLSQIVLVKDKIFGRLVVNGRVVALMCLALFSDASPESRYDKGRALTSSRYSQEHAAKSINNFGEDVITSLPVLLYEISSSSAYSTGLLHFADVASSLAWEHVLPPTCPYYNQNAPEDGKRLYICMYRGVTCHILSWPTVGGTLMCYTWVSKTGKSTFTLRVDFRDSANRGVACIEFTMVVVNRLKMKSSPVFHSKEWAEERYRASALRGLPAELSLPDLQNLTMSTESFVYHLEKLRHSDQDQNGHVNSAKYLDLVHDARAAVLRSNTFAAWIRELVGREGWIRRFGIDYIAELKMSDKHPVVKVYYYASGSREQAVLLFEISTEDKVCTKVWVETSSHFDSIAQSNSQPINDEEGSLHGCIPEQWGVPSQLIQEGRL